MKTSAIPTPSSAAPDASPRRFAFGGVAFEVSPERSLPWALPPGLRRFVEVDEPGPVAGVVRVCARGASERAAADDSSLQWSWGEERCEVRSGAAHAQLRRVLDDRYAATGTTTPTDQGCADLLRGLSAAVIDRAGGLLLHAAAITLEGQAVLFIGPSGAASAARRCEGARWLGHDHVALFLRRGRWYATGLPGAHASDLAPDARRVRPLGAVCVVAEPGSADASTDAAAAVSALRESLRVPKGVDMSTLADRCEAALRSCAVRRIHPPFDAPLGPILRDAMRR